MSESSGPNNWNQKIIEEFRANEGKIGGYFEGAHMILIHHIGARSGTERVNPLAYLPDGDDMIIVATKGGVPQRTRTGITTSRNTLASRSRSARRPSESMRQRVTGEERNELWHRLVEFSVPATRQDPIFPMLAAF